VSTVSDCGVTDYHALPWSALATYNMYGWTLSIRRAPNPSDEAHSRHYYARRPAPRHALALALLREVLALLADRLRGACDPVGTRHLERQAPTL
jgi:hypothetical protein